MATRQRSSACPPGWALARQETPVCPIHPQFHRQVLEEQRCQGRPSWLHCPRPGHLRASDSPSHEASRAFRAQRPRQTSPLRVARAGKRPRWPSQAGCVLLDDFTKPHKAPLSLSFCAQTADPQDSRVLPAPPGTPTPPQSQGAADRAHQTAACGGTGLGSALCNAPQQAPWLGHTHLTPGTQETTSG